MRKSEKAALAQAFDYFDSVVSTGIKRVDDVERDEEMATYKRPEDGVLVVSIGCLKE